MQNFLRVIRLALRRRYAIAASIVCSLIVGVLWGGNIAVLYPVVEVVFRGESSHQWAEKRVAARDQIREEAAAAVAKLKAELEQTADGDRARIQTQLEFQRKRLAQEEGTLARTRQQQQWIDRYMPGRPFQDLVVIVALLMLGTIVKSSFLAAHVILVSWIQQRTILDLRNSFFSKTLSMDLAAFAEQKTSGLMSKFTFDLKVLESSLGMLFGQAVREPLKMIACLTGAALISWQLLLISLVMIPLGLLIMRRLAKSMKKVSGISMDVIAELYARLAESFNGIKVVKAFTMENSERRRFDDVGRGFLRIAMRFSSYMAFFKPVSETMGIAVVSCAVLLGAYLTLNQATHVFGIKMSSEPLSPGALMVFFGMLAGIADPARKMSDIYAALIGGVMASDRIYALMDCVPSIREPDAPVSISHPHRQLIFQNTHFHYQPGELVLKDIQLTINYGETVAFLGPNGCGKSTLVNLVLRFYDPTQGKLLIDGVDLREMSLKDLRRRIGLVTQETLLFDETVLDNIRYGSPDATEEQAIEAAKRAHAHAFITEVLEQGYRTVVGPGGGRLSGGQRQRIAMARAILRDPEILILDEATSQIDIESEHLIHQALANFKQGRTTLLISHRLSTLSLADRIVVMDDGRILACGTHEELSSQCDFYRRLHDFQERKAA